VLISGIVVTHTLLRRIRPTLAALLLAACSGADDTPGGGATGAAPDLPAATGTPRARGVLVVLVDTLRADHVGVYGGPPGLTPHMDALAAESLIFENAVATSSWTRSSVASLFTGRYPTAIDVLTKEDALSQEVVTLAELLSAAGYATYAVSANANAGAHFGFSQGFLRFEDDLPQSSDNTAAEDAPVQYFPMVSAEAVTQRGFELLDAHPADEPFFLYLHYVDPHGPYLPHPGVLDEPEPAGRFSGSRQDLAALDALSDDERTAADEARIRWLYAGEVKYCDQWLGRLFEGLAERGLYDELLIVLTSDHGEGLWDHEVRFHGKDLYEEMVHVPLLLRYPDAFGVAPERVREVVSHVDVAPTILEACGLEPPPQYQGRRLLGVEADVRSGRRAGTAYAELTTHDIDIESIRDGDEKLIRDRSLDPEKAAPFDYVVRPRDTLLTIARRHPGRMPRRILEANPGLAPPDADWESIVLEPGSVLHMPSRERLSMADAYEWFLLTKDPGELNDISRVGEGRGSALHELLAHYRAMNEAGRILGEETDVENLDPALADRLRELGYIGN
jgi:arylsulfatase